ncbi:urocortin-3 [Ochotona curzoniae]|uniref:urocortin-3 n=1 Tax=Ochotona curzoniae TaxID=130825 RepID=UPI001B34644A|nr:urocortin-3 [Ochotona curzoniae]
MLRSAYFLLLLLLLFPEGPRTGLSHNLYKDKPTFSCLNTALSAAKKSQLGDVPPLSKASFFYLSNQDPSSEEEQEGKENQDKVKRTSPGSGGNSGSGNIRYKYLSQAQLRGKVYQDKGKSDRHSKLTLSLDVPTNIMNILFNIAKAKNLQAKAAANAHLMAQIGRKK